MPYVQVPKDLSKVKTKLAFNLTKRQLICFSGAAAVGIPTYLLTRSTIGNSPALFLMIGLMLPFFFFAMFERDGLPFEKVLRNFIRARFLWPTVRPYKTENFYAAWSGPETSGQLDPKPEHTPKGGTGIAKNKRGKTARPEAGQR
ncbi:MAG: PrgI family protein [Enterocloster asparagiformis]|nr:PrgI family protein [Enterocloster asparagiformis]